MLRADLADPAAPAVVAEAAARRITVNAVGPGSTMSGPFGQMTAEQKTEASSAFALGRIGEPADTAAVVAFLASEDAGFVTGQVIYAAGRQRGPIRLGR
jgi:3-oxoacyl-[acyl-carrier protein] reductase